MFNPKMIDRVEHTLYTMNERAKVVNSIACDYIRITFQCLQIVCSYILHLDSLIDAAESGSSS